MAPVVALAEPDELLRLRQVAPVDAAVAAFEEGGDLLFEHVADRAGGGVGDAQRLPLCDRARWRRRRAASHPCPTARRPIRRRGRRRCRTAWSGAGRAAVCRRTTRGPSRSMITRWIVVTTSSPGSGYFHACSVRMAHLGFHQVHFADAALILLEGGDPLGIGRPQHDRAGCCWSSRRCRWRSRNP